MANMTKPTKTTKPTKKAPVATEAIQEAHVVAEVIEAAPAIPTTIEELYTYVTDEIKKLNDRITKVVVSIDSRFDYVPKADHNHRLEELNGWKGFIEHLLSKVAFNEHEHDFHLSDDAIAEVKEKLDVNVDHSEIIRTVMEQTTARFNELAQKIANLPTKSGTGQTIPYLMCSQEPFSDNFRMFQMQICNPSGMCMYKAYIEVEAKYSGDLDYLVLETIPTETEIHKASVEDTRPTGQVLEAVRFSLKSSLNSAYTFKQVIRVR